MGDQPSVQEWIVIAYISSTAVEKTREVREPEERPVPFSSLFGCLCPLVYAFMIRVSTIKSLLKKCHIQYDIQYK